METSDVMISLETSQRRTALCTLLGGVSAQMALSTLPFPVPFFLHSTHYSLELYCVLVFSSPPSVQCKFWRTQIVINPLSAEGGT